MKKWFEINTAPLSSKNDFSSLPGYMWKKNEVYFIVLGLLGSKKPHLQAWLCTHLPVTLAGSDYSHGREGIGELKKGWRRWRRWQERSLKRLASSKGCPPNTWGWWWDHRAWAAATSTSIHWYLYFWAKFWSRRKRHDLFDHFWVYLEKDQHAALI